ncbi:MAG TPA: hypothetical protein VFC78_17430 [Tepidisphaeraceae bacterium]|nr:hypothetical protein [Tepidisphaeraceae bacterium]
MARIAFILLLTFCASGLRAAPPGVTRVLRTFDFEERRLGNNEDLPMNWVKVEGPGLPHYVNGKLAEDRAHGGKYSFRFDLNGGSLVYRYPSGKIAAQPGSRYHIDGFVQTTVLANARARISAYFTDIDGKLLPKTVCHSDLYAARVEGDAWKQLRLEASTDDVNAQWLVLELELLQPAQYTTTALGKRAIFPQDIHGSAWFDDITISQVPGVAISTDRVGNVFHRDDPLRLSVVVDDPFVDDLSTQLVVKDANGREVYQHSGGLDPASAQPQKRGHKKLGLTLPNLQPGWYQASLAMSSQKQSLGTHVLNFIRLPDNAPASKPDPRFGVDATALPFDGWSELPQVLQLLSAGRVKLALWTKTSDIAQMDSRAFDQLIGKLADLDIAPTACLLDLPPAISRKIGGGGSWPQLLTASPADWQPQLATLISRQASHLDRWQLGADGSDAFATDPRMRKVYGLVYAQFQALMNQPDLAMPWPAWYDLEGELPATVALSVPASVLPNQLPLYMQDLRGHAGHNLSIQFAPLDRAKYGRTAQIRDLAQRVVYSMSAGATRIDFPLPFVSVGEEDEAARQPTELLMIERTLTATLGGTTYKGKVPIADGVEAFLFDRNGQGLLALWSQTGDAALKTLPVNLGPRPVCVDLWGNVTPLLRARGEKAIGKVQLTVGPMPTFLLDIDGPQAQLRASLAFDRPLLESSFQAHNRRIHFYNPYPTLVAGTLKLRAPPGWTFNPPTINFSLNAGESLDREVQISFPYNSFAGPKPINCEFALEGEADANFTVPLTLNLGLSDVGMQAIALRDGNDILVQQTVSNYGEKPIDYTGFAIFPGSPRQERLVTQLGAGRTVMKRYRFKDARPGKQAMIRVGLRELRGTRVLNEEVAVQ